MFDTAGATSAQTKIGNGEYWWNRYPTEYPDVTVFPADGTPLINDVRQGGAGTCYLMSSIAAVAEQPQLIKDVFLVDNKNDAGIYAFTLHIRGKPWVVDIDDEMLWQFPPPYVAQLVYSQLDQTNSVIWSALLEKAWAKIRGSYDQAYAGQNENGMRLLTGVPIFTKYGEDITDTAEATAAWQELKAADTRGFFMNAGTSGESDQTSNSCGIANSHSYTIAAVFELTYTPAGGSETTEKVFLMRNPWGETGYTSTFNKDDAVWND